MSAAQFLLLGCGYTASRVARQLSAAGAHVVCTNRTQGEIQGVDCVDLDAADPNSLAALPRYLTENMTVLHSIPPASTPDGSLEYTAPLLDVLRPLNPKRIIYLSTTGLYGDTEYVNEQTPAAPVTERDVLRHQAENLITAGPWSSLMLRIAAIYGPGRGIHVSIRDGVFRPPGKADRLVSRIHVDDLASLITAALLNELTGAFPVADDEPATSLDVAQLSSQLLGIAFTMHPPRDSDRAQRTMGRSVDGTALRNALGITLRYQSFRQGIPACLQAESSIQKLTQD